jgi:hypothetical protein
MSEEYVCYHVQYAKLVPVLLSGGAHTTVMALLFALHLQVVS